MVSEEAADRLEAEVRAEVEAAVTFAEQSPLPAPEDALEDVFAAPTPSIVVTERPAAPERTELTHLEANMQAIADEMRRDPHVFFMGQDVRLGLYGDFRFRSFLRSVSAITPISEAGFVGAGVGAAMTGMRPVIQMGFATFLYSAMDQVVNQAAKLRYMSGGQARVPLVLLAPCYYTSGSAAHHCDRPFALFANSPGLKVVVPTTAYDMKGIMIAAIREDDPVNVFSDASLWGVRGPVGEGDCAIPLGVADVKREGQDVTVVAVAGAVALALTAAERLGDEGVSGRWSILVRSCRLTERRSGSRSRRQDGSSSSIPARGTAALRQKQSPRPQSDVDCVPIRFG